MPWVFCQSRLNLAFASIRCAGYGLYQSFVVVWTGDKHTSFSQFCLFAFGVPAVVVATTAAIDRNNYGDRDGLCYLSGNAVWAFAGPALAVMAVNVWVCVFAPTHPTVFCLRA